MDHRFPGGTGVLRDRELWDRFRRQDSRFVGVVPDLPAEFDWEIGEEFEGSWFGHRVCLMKLSVNTLPTSIMITYYDDQYAGRSN